MATDAIRALGLTDEDLRPPTQQRAAGQGPASLQSLGLSAADFAEQPAGAQAGQGQQEAFDPRELPSVDPQTGQDLPADAQGRPTPDAADISQAPNRRRGFAETVEPFVQPFTDVMAGANRAAVGALDLPGTAINAAAEVAGIDQRVPRLQDQPVVQAGTTPSATEGGELRAIAGEFGALGGAMNVAARQAVGAVPSVTYGSDSIMRGILKDVARTPVGAEVGLGAASGVGAEVGGDVAGTPGEIAGGILAPLAMIRRPRMPGRSGEDTAAAILQREADRPVEAAARMEGRADRPLTAMERTDDPGIMTLYRSMARHDASLAGDIDEAFRLNQQSLQRELQEVITPDGTPDPEALSNFLATRRDDLLALQDDAIRGATEEMLLSARVSGETDPVQISRRFRDSLEKLIPDVRQQERALWQISNPDVPTQPLRDTALEIVRNAPKTARLPKRELEQIIGRRIRAGSENWEVTDQAVQGSLSATEPAEAIITLRSNLLDDIRNQTKGALTRPKSVPIMQRLQSASLDTLDQAMVDPSMKEAYDTARAYTRRMHEVFEQGIVGRVLSTNPSRGDTVLPEQTLRTMLEGGREQQAAAARELTDTVMMETGVRGTSPSQSPLARDVGQYMRARFQEEATDANSAREFLIENQQMLRRAPELRRELEQATQGMQQASGKIATATEQKELIGKAKFNNLIGMNGKQAVAAVLREQNPGKAAVNLRKQLADSPEAIDTFKQDTADYVLSRVFEVAKLPGMDQQLTKRGMVNALREVNPILRTFYSADDVKRLRTIMDDVASMSAFRAATPRNVDQPRNVLMDLAGRMIPTMAVANLTKGSSIVMQSFAARAGRQLTDSLSTKQVQKILTRAATDDKLMKTLLKKELNKKDIQRLRSIIPEAGMTGGEAMQPALEQREQAEQPIQ